MPLALRRQLLPAFALLVALPLSCGGAATPAPNAPDPVTSNVDPNAPVATTDATAAPSTGNAPSQSGTSPEAFVAAHNRARAQHCAPPIAWSTKIAASAQQWADTLKRNNCGFDHSKTQYGENLAGGSGLDADAVVKMWFDERSQYDYANGGFSMNTGHFTQVVWSGTREFGCGSATCNGMDTWVCQYDPPGNFEGQYRPNVLPPTCRK